MIIALVRIFDLFKMHILYYRPYEVSHSEAGTITNFYFYRNRRSDRFRMTYAEIEGTCCWNLCHRNGQHCEKIELGLSREINIFAFRITAEDCDDYYDY